MRRPGTIARSNLGSLIILAMILATMLVLALSTLVVLFLRSERQQMTENRIVATTEKEATFLQRGRELPTPRGLQFTPSPAPLQLRGLSEE